jgi:hypothetical protein
VRAQAGGGELIPIGRSIIDAATQMSIEATKGLGSELVWPGLLRRLQRQMPGYDQ